MREIDRKLAEALRIDEEALFDVNANERSIIEEVADTFRGRRRWAVIMAWVFAALLAALMFTGAIMFFRTEVESEKLAWGLGCIFGMVGNGLLKTWFWLEMNRNSVLREIKRVELQIARLAERIPPRDDPGPDA